MVSDREKVDRKPWLWPVATVLVAAVGAVAIGIAVRRIGTSSPEASDVPMFAGHKDVPESLGIAKRKRRMRFSRVQRMRRWSSSRLGRFAALIICSFLLLGAFLYFSQRDMSGLGNTSGAFYVFAGPPPQADGDRTIQPVSSFPEFGGLEFWIYQRPNGWVVRISAELGWTGEEGGPLDVIFLAPRGSRLIGSQPLGATHELSSGASEVFVLRDDFSDDVATGFKGEPGRKHPVTLDIEVPESTIYVQYGQGDGVVIADFKSPAGDVTVLGEATYTLYQDLYRADGWSPAQQAEYERLQDRKDAIFGNVSDSDCQGKTVVSLTTETKRISSVVLLENLAQSEAVDNRAQISGSQAGQCLDVPFRASLVDERQRNMNQAILYVLAILAGLLLSALLLNTRPYPHAPVQ
jgi:hypothetical protein